MNPVEEQIIEIVNRETRAWDTQDVEMLLTIFHPDMVWPWPKNPQSHDPVDWIMDQGRYNYERWKQGWQELFDTQRLVHNNREIVKIALSNEEDGALAVVDIDTLWIDSEGNHNHWKGRVGKVYSLVEGEWKMTMHIGVLDYSK